MRKIIQSISTIIANTEPLLYVRKIIGNRIPRYKANNKEKLSCVDFRKRECMECWRQRIIDLGIILLLN